MKVGFLLFFFFFFFFSPNVLQSSLRSSFFVLRNFNPILRPYSLFRSRALIPVSGVRFFSVENGAKTESASSPPPPPPPSSSSSSSAETPKKKSFWLTPLGVLGIGGVALFGYLMATYVKDGITRFHCLQVENSCMTKLDELHQDAVQNGLLYVHAKLAHRILDDHRVISDMGSIRFQPESMRIVPLLKENRNFLTFNIYGTKRVGSVNAVLSKRVLNGWIVYKVEEMTVDAWDGKVFEIDCTDLAINYESVFEEIKSRLAKTKQPKKE